MLPIQIIGPAAVSAEALLRLELLLGERVVDLSSVSDIVTQDDGLKTHVLQLAHDTGRDIDSDSDSACAHSDGADLSMHECIVEIGIEQLRESLRQTRFRLRAN
jgi:hypothetical protein